MIVGHYLPPSFLSRASWRSCRRLMALARHLQHAKIDNDTSRHSAQFACPQNKHFVLRRGQSSRLAISWAYYFESHYRYRVYWLLSLKIELDFALPIWSGLICHVL